jgi:predicted transcriptional regulator
MPKSIYRPEYTVLRTQLRQARERAGLTQIDLSEAIGASQTYISHVERVSDGLTLSSSGISAGPWAWI